MHPAPRQEMTDRRSDGTGAQPRNAPQVDQQAPTEPSSRESTEAWAALPDPDDHPDRDVVIWDGKCRFCRRQVERLHRLDGGRLSYLSLHDKRVEERYPGLSKEQLMEQIWLVTRDGQFYGGADALRVLSRRLPGLWLLAPLLHAPGTMPLWRRLYSWFAVRRYRLSDCEDGTCHLHRR